MFTVIPSEARLKQELAGHLSEQRLHGLEIGQSLVSRICSGLNHRYCGSTVSREL